MNDKKEDKKISKKKVIDVVVGTVACVIDLCVCIYLLYNMLFNRNADSLSSVFDNINIMKPFSTLFVVNVLYFNYIMLSSAKTRDERINFIKIEILILVCLGFIGLLSMLFGSHTYSGFFDFSS